MVWFLGRAREFSHLQSLQTSSWTHPISYGYWGFFLYSAWGVKLTTDPCLMLRLRTEWSYDLLPHVPSWHKLTLPSLYFTLWMSMANISPGCWQVQTVKNWKWSDKSCFTFLKYNDGHDSTFCKILLSQAFKDMLQDKQYRYEHNLLRTSDMMS